MSEPNPQKSFPTWIMILFQIVIVVLSIAIGYFAHRIIARHRGDMALLREAQRILIGNTILEIPDDPALEYGMIRGMLMAMDDPYTYFVEPAAHEIRSNELAGRFGGVGIRLERDTQANWRVYPLPDSPALSAGIEDGDLLLAVDDLEVHAESSEETLIAAIRGPEGERVNITVQRDQDVLTFSINRQMVPLPSITWNLVPEVTKIGIIRVNRIAETTANEIKEAIKTLQEQGAIALIIDLRNNGGGLVDAGVNIARMFLENGVVINQTYRGDVERSFIVEEPGPYIDLPLVLLINQHTASAAEIVAGALTAHQRASLIGTATHGKTSIQFIFELQDGSSVNITGGNWSVPGVTFPLQPDFEVGDDPDGVILLQTALDVLQYILKE